MNLPPTVKSQTKVETKKTVGGEVGVTGYCKKGGGGWKKISVYRSVSDTCKHRGSPT